MRISVPRPAALAVALALAVLTCSYYVFIGHRRMSALTGAAFRIDSADAQQSTDPQALVALADHFYWLNNGTAAGPLYARAEKLYSEQGDARNELHAKVGRLRSEAETMSFVELSRFLNEQLQNPIVQNDKKLRLWCLIAKGYTDIEIRDSNQKLKTTLKEDTMTESSAAHTLSPNNARAPESLRAVRFALHP